jgi:MFS family permease
MHRTAAIDSSYAWVRLAAALALTTVGSAGMYITMVGLTAVQADFDVSRGSASLPYMMVMLGFGVGGIVIGWAVDRYGIVRPLAVCTFALAATFAAVAQSQSFAVVALLHAGIGGFGCAAVFAPLLADISGWFLRRRGMAIAICASGNYIAGAIWPTVMQSLIADVGWRQTYELLGIASIVLMLPLLLVLVPRPTGEIPVVADGGSAGSPAMLGLTPRGLVMLLSVAGVGCCTAMAMPQVHVVSLSVELGHGAAAGAEILSLMFGAGVVSRLAFGAISDRIGGLRTLLIGSLLQCIALMLFLPAASLSALHMAALLFGLFQGGIVPSYALIVREYFRPAEAARRIGVVIFATLVGMAFGGWISGAIFDWTKSYDAAFLHGIGWNLVNIGIMAFLVLRARQGAGPSVIGSAGSATHSDMEPS